MPQPCGHVEQDPEICQPPVPSRLRQAGETAFCGLYGGNTGPRIGSMSGPVTRTPGLPLWGGVDLRDRVPQKSSHLRRCGPVAIAVPGAAASNVVNAAAGLDRVLGSDLDDDVEDAGRSKSIDCLDTLT